jgi:syntaxin 7/syntaxin 12/13
VGKIKRRFKLLNNDIKGKLGHSDAVARSKMINKLSADFKSQLAQFQKSCENVVEVETTAVQEIRRSSSSSHAPNRNNPKHKVNGFGFHNYNEDQLYAQAQVTTYDEDDMMRREEDILHINHQLKEINIAYKEIDGLVQDQGEVVVEIADNVENAQENAHAALDQVKAADSKSRYCMCSKWKLIFLGILLLIVVILVLTVYREFK